MSKPIEGEPAFPSPPAGTGDPRDGMTTGHAGLSERRYYIGQALMGFCANPGLTQASYRDVAGRAITQADEVMQFLYPQPKETNNEKQVQQG